MKKLVLLSILLTGCAQSSGVMTLGPDTYTVSVHAAPARGGEPEAKKLALTEAGNYCAGMGKQIAVQSMDSKPSSHLPGGTVDLIFQCLSDKEAKGNRPVYRTPPDLVIETRH